MDQDMTREQKYADLIGRLYLTTSDGGCHTIEDIADAVMAVADEEIRQAKAEAWGEGHATRQQREVDGCLCGAYYEGECGCGEYGTGRIITPNPYR